MQTEIPGGASYTKTQKFLGVLNEQKLEQEQSFAEERRIRSSFLDFMAKTINKYGKTLLNEQHEKGKAKNEQRR